MFLASFRFFFSAVALTENGSTSLSLIADHTTHGDFLSEDLTLVSRRSPPDDRVVGVFLNARTSKIGKWACRVDC